MSSEVRPPAVDLACGLDEFGEFVRPHWALMSRFAQRLCGAEWEDVLQDALLLAWRKHSQFDPGRGTPRAWLLTLVADRARKLRRRQVGRVAVALVDDPASAADTPADVDLGRAVDALPRRQRQAVELYYFLDLPVAEIAVVMSCAPGTVKSTLAQARESLRTQLAGEP